MTVLRQELLHLCLGIERGLVGLLIVSTWVAPRAEHVAYSLAARFVIPGQVLPGLLGTSTIRRVHGL